jgi:hypothetical protein
MHLQRTPAVRLGRPGPQISPDLLAMFGGGINPRVGFTRPPAPMAMPLRRCRMPFGSWLGWISLPLPTPAGTVSGITLICTRLLGIC